MKIPNPFSILKFIILTLLFIVACTLVFIGVIFMWLAKVVTAIANIIESLGQEIF